jgi:SAM-dependent methyltransferase
MILDIAKISSVLDVGCGVGTWLQVFAENGVTDYLGIDGDYVDRRVLQIPADRFRSMDLRQELDVGRRFDLACSLEVAEHLPSSIAGSLIGALVKAAPLVLFSAATPGQGGTHHINEQWQSYWVEHFARFGYLAVDCIRPRVTGNQDVEWWYQQNILLFCEPAARPAGFESASDPHAFDRVHPRLLEEVLRRPHTGRQALVAIGRAASVLARAGANRLFRA